jgi:hypothetical protein
MSSLGIFPALDINRTVTAEVLGIHLQDIHCFLSLLTSLKDEDVPALIP